MQSCATSSPPPSVSATSSPSPIRPRPARRTQLKKGLTAAQETISELRAQIEEGAQKLASAKADCDRQLKAKEEAAEQRIAELEAQHAERLSAAEQERKRLLSELDELRPQVEEYGRVKAHIADIELSAVSAPTRSTPPRGSVCRQ